MIFSQRYNKLIYDNNGELINDFCSEIDANIKQKIINVLLSFKEPQIFNPNRYDNYQVTTTALESAIDNFCEIMGTSTKRFYLPVSHSLSLHNGLETIYLFDIIELQYIELSIDEKVDFQHEINSVLSENDLPWVLLEGSMIKIDSRQFEFDIQEKMLLQLQELKSYEPKFQSAFKELLDAHESFDKQDYSTAISKAEMCYESILKIICEQRTGNAQSLTTEYVNKHIGTIPATMNKNGFRDNVLMSLPYMRNNSGTDHGAGEVIVVITKEFARLAINLSAALCAYLLDVYKQETKL